VIPKCPSCGVELGPWEDHRCIKCGGGYSYWTIGDRAVRLLEESDQALAHWDVRRLLRAQGHPIWQPTVTATLGTDRRFCWAGRGIYGLYRHGFLPGVRDLARVGGIYLHAADRRLTLAELDFVLKFVGYRYQEVSLRNALRREAGLGLYKQEWFDTWAGIRASDRQRREAARAIGLLGRPAIVESIIDRAARQVDDALDERERRLTA
jgi:hypothetical protein